MTGKRGFWTGVLVGFLAGFLYGWLAIWITYTELERAHMKREAEMRQIKRILYLEEDLFRQSREIFEWNCEAVLPDSVAKPKEKQ